MPKENENQSQTQRSASKSEEQNKQPSAESENPIERGKKMIEVQKHTSGKSPGEAEKENGEDANKWRNEG